MRKQLKVLTVGLAFFTCTVFAQTSVHTETQNALRLITETAVNLCSNPQLSGSRTTTELSIGAKAEVAGLLKRLVAIGVSTGAKFQDERYVGLLQSDLLFAMRDSNTCRLRVFEGLRDRVLDQVTPSGAKTATNSSKASASSFYGSTRCQAEATEDGNSASCEKGLK